MKNEFKYLSGLNKERHEEMFENLMIYRGIQFAPDDQKTLNDFIDTLEVEPGFADFINFCSENNLKAEHWLRSCEYFQSFSELRAHSPDGSSA